MGWKCLSECRRRARMRHRRNDDDVDGRQENFPTKSWWFVWMWQTTERRWRRRTANENTEKYSVCQVIFGVTCAPSVANAERQWALSVNDGGRVCESRERCLARTWKMIILSNDLEFQISVTFELEFISDDVDVCEWLFNWLHPCRASRVCVKMTNEVTKDTSQR